MKAALAPTDLVASKMSKADRWSFAVTFLFFACLWLEVVNHLKAEWSVNPQYGYGWFVPLISIYLFWKRWPGRPNPDPPASRVLPLTLLALCALVLFPIRFLTEANPDWRLLSWAVSGTAVSASICLMFLAGGRPWATYFAFPFLFFLVAVPWPMQFEQWVTQNLMRAVTAINVALVNDLGIPAVQQGNVIEVGTGLIGIEEACSGVRSLQATLMISLFLGELYTFRWRARILLIAAGAFIAFICNLVRTALLVWVGATRGTHAIEGWHDPAGLTILFVCLIALWLLSLLIQHRSGTAIEAHSINHKSAPLFRFARPILVSVIVWLLLVELGVQAWYRQHQSNLVTTRWGVRWPSAESGYKPVAIPRETESLLRYNEGGGAAWAGADGHRWTMFFFHWLPGRTAALFVKIHRPDVCLPASGLTMVRENSIRLIQVNGVNLPIRSYRFNDHGVALHIFYCYWDARSSYQSIQAANEEDWTARGRIRAAFRGQREVGAQMLEVAVWGYDDDGQANAALERELSRIVGAG